MEEVMRIAVTKGTLQIPPTYFAIEHAVALPEIYWHVFTLAARISLDLPFGVTEATPSKLSFSAKEKLKYLALGNMRRQITDARPDLIHQHMTTWSSPAQGAAKNLDVPLVTTVHGSDLFTVDYRGYSPLPRWNKTVTESAIEESTRIVAVSTYLADRARERSVPDSKIAVIYQGVDTDFFIPGSVAPLAEDRREFLFVGSLNDQKGILDLIKSSISLFPSFPHDLTVVGDGQYFSHIKDLARSHPHIHPEGSMTRDGVRLHMQRADALVLPTRTWQGRQEAAGLVLLEAQACGTPVITHSVGGTPEMVAPNRGWLTDENNLESLTQAMREVIQMPQNELLDLSLQVREWVVRERSSKVGANHLAGLFSELVH